MDKGKILHCITVALPSAPVSIIGPARKLRFPRPAYPAYSAYPAYCSRQAERSLTPC